MASAVTTQLVTIGSAVQAAWIAKYGPSGTASASANSSITANVLGKLTFTMLDKGSAGYQVAASASIAAGTVTATNAKNIGYVVGVTRATTDNKTSDTDVIMTLTSNVAGTVLNKIGSSATDGVNSAGSGVKSVTSGSNALIELLTTKLTNGTDPQSGLHKSVSGRNADVVNAENLLLATAPTTAAVNKTRVHWLGV